MTVGKALEAFSEYFDQGKVGVAVSGGGDSVALLCALSETMAEYATRVVVYSVDHGLRPEAADEIRFVSELAARLGHEHRALSWRWDKQGNLSASARDGRYQVISDAAKADGIKTVLLGHTKDDRAETVLMALARSAGVDGLAGMQAVKQDRGITWLRPLLSVTRNELRAYLTARGQSWIDDPTNENEAYERVRMRKAAEMLSDLGITADALSDVALNMHGARDVLEATRLSAMKEGCVVLGGSVRIDRTLFSAWDFEIRRRVLVKCLAFVAPNASAPRRAALLNAMRGDSDFSLSGCLVLFKKDHIWVVREPNAVVEVEAHAGDVWDSKWRFSGDESGEGLVIRALGEDGIKSCKNWREAGFPRPALLSSPAIWQNDRLIAAPLVGYGGEWSAEMLLGAEDFLS